MNSFGVSPWANVSLKDLVSEFHDLYNTRPVKDNHAGMMSPHMFAVWVICKQLQPELIVESGVYKGQSTWLLEKACPSARIISIDLHLECREYISPNVEYSNVDFSEHDWTNIPSNSLVFFDDHQNALKRLQQCIWFGFNHLIFEDNYPSGKGDCYSLKQAFQCSGYGKIDLTEKISSYAERIVRKFLRTIRFGNGLGMTEYFSKTVAPNSHDKKYIQKWLESYNEFPPIFKRKSTRWGDEWNDLNYPTLSPIFNEDKKDLYRDLFEEAIYYTWVCYAKIKD